MFFVLNFEPIMTSILQKTWNLITFFLFENVARMQMLFKMNEKDVLKFHSIVFFYIIWI